MGEFKPMTKMMTTEPSVVLKLKKGGPVARPRIGKPAMSGAGPAMVGRPMAMKDGGEAPSVHKKEMKAISNTEKALKKHKEMPASKAHKGLKTGGVVKGQGGYKTGGVVNGQGGFCEGGNVMKKAVGGAVEMPARPKTPGPKVGALSGTYKKGGMACAK